MKVRKVTNVQLSIFKCIPGQIRLVFMKDKEVRLSSGKVGST